MSIDPRIPLGAVAQGGSAINPMQSLMQVYQLQNMQQQRQESQERIELSRQQQNRLSQQAQIEAQDAAAAKQQETALRELFGSGQRPKPEQLYGIVGPKRGSEILTGLEALETSRAKRSGEAQGLIGPVLTGLMALPTEEMRAEMYGGIRNQWVQDGVIRETDAPAEYPGYGYLQYTQRRMMTPQQQYEIEHPKPERIETVGAAGEKVSKYVEPKVGAEFPAAPASPVQVETLDPSGKPITQFVTPKVGATFPKPPPQVQPTYMWAQKPDGSQVLATPQEIRAQGLVKTADAPAQLNIFDPGIPQDMRTLAAGSMSRIRGEASRQFAAASLNDAWKNDDPEHSNYKRVLKNTVIDNLNVDKANVVTARTDLLQSIKGIRGILTELQQRGGVPTGILEGNLEDMQRYLGKSTDTRLVELGVQLDELRNVYRRGTTGIQFSKEEAAQYDKMFPKYTNDAKVNMALLAGLERATQRHDWVFWNERFGNDGAKFVGAINPDQPKVAPAGGGRGAPGGAAPPPPGMPSFDQMKPRGR